MASSAITIDDYAAALGTTIPGELGRDGLVFQFPPVVYTGVRGATHSWRVSVRLLRDGKPVAIGLGMLRRGASLAGHRAEITVESGQVDGKVRDVVPTYVDVGKNLGKKNETNVLMQALRDALGMYNKHARRGNTTAGPSTAASSEAGPSSAGPSTAASSEAGPSTAASSEAGPSSVASSEAGPSAPVPSTARPPPQLVKKLGESAAATLTEEDFQKGITVQRKLNGVRYVFPLRAGAGGELSQGYSRTGLPFPGSPQITRELEEIMRTVPDLPPVPGSHENPALAKAVPYLDGELYTHGESLQWISGQARREDDAGRLDYHVYDVFFPEAIAAGYDATSSERQYWLRGFFWAVVKSIKYPPAEPGAPPLTAAPHRYVLPVENFPARDLDEVHALAKRFVSEGYEGAIARRDVAGYKYSFGNYHSANLLKIKPLYDSEFPVVGFTQGAKGKDVGALIWVCEVPAAMAKAPDDREFHVVPKNMTYPERKALFAKLSEVVPAGAGPSGEPRPAETRFERVLKGLPLTVEYPELSSKTGKPLQAKAVAFRTYESGPESDPVRKLLAE